MSDITLDIKLHPAQLEVFTDPHRFRVLMAGRRFGKTVLARTELITAVLQDFDDQGRPLKHTVVWYVAPSYPVAKEIMWEPLKDQMAPVIRRVSEKEMWIEAINGRRIYIKGAEKPDSLRGRGVSMMVLDEVDSMRDNLWDVILRPTLADVQGRALFIGTPAPGGELARFYQYGEDPEMLDWKSWHFSTFDNPFIDNSELEDAKRTMSSAAYQQEIMADPNAVAGSALDLSHLKFAPKSVVPGVRLIAVDLAGFMDENTAALTAKKGNKKKLNTDETAIALVEVSQEGWFVHKIIHGRWGVRETALRIIQAAQSFKPVAVGIEQGALRNAVLPYLKDNMVKLGVFPTLIELKHGGTKKTERIIWALQGRLEHDSIVFNSEENWDDFLKQARAFPHPYMHDDLLDALAYIDQMAPVAPVAADRFRTSNFTPVDEYAGY